MSRIRCEETGQTCTMSWGDILELARKSALPIVEHKNFFEIIGEEKILTITKLDRGILYEQRDLDIACR